MEPVLPATELLFRLTAFVPLIGTAIMAAIVVLNNLSAPRSNFLFIEHIMTMDTTYQAPGTVWRAIRSPRVHWAAFVFIVFCEALVAVFGFMGSVELLIHLRMPTAAWDAAKYYGYLSFLVALFVWFFIFQVVGAEWFESWQSEQWNGIRDSIRINLITVSGILLLRLS